MTIRDQKCTHCHALRHFLPVVCRLSATQNNTIYTITPAALSALEHFQKLCHRMDAASDQDPKKETWAQLQLVICQLAQARTFSLCRAQTYQRHLPIPFQFVTSQKSFATSCLVVSLSEGVPVSTSSFTANGQGKDSVFIFKAYLLHSSQHSTSTIKQNFHHR